MSNGSNRLVKFTGLDFMSILLVVSRFEFMVEFTGQLLGLV